jgi:hypothetical protein
MTKIADCLPLVVDEEWSAESLRQAAKKWARFAVGSVLLMLLSIPHYALSDDGSLRTSELVVRFILVWASATMLLYVIVKAVSLAWIAIAIVPMLLAIRLVNGWPELLFAMGTLWKRTALARVAWHCFAAFAAMRWLISSDGLLVMETCWAVACAYGFCLVALPMRELRIHLRW